MHLQLQGFFILSFRALCMALPKTSGGMAQVYFCRFLGIVFKTGRIEHEAHVYRTLTSSPGQRPPESLVCCYAHIPCVRALVLHYCGRSTLSNYIYSGGPQMPIDAVVDSALRILEALQYLHKLGFVHGDVKPANCCYGPNGATLIDIGNAWKQGSSEKPPANSNYLHLPPELMILDDPIPSHHGDLWGVGIILYRLIEQSFPFGNDVLSSTTLNMLRCYAKHEYRDRKPTFKGPVHPIHSIITKMLSFDRSDRYPTAEAVLHALRATT